MKDLLKFFGIPVPDSARVTDVMISFHGLDPGWAIPLGLLIVALVVTVYLLIDSSASMGIKDMRQDDADIKRAGIATGVLDPRAGLSQPLPAGVSASSLNQLARSDVLKQMLTNDRLNLLAKLSQTYNIVPYTFGQTLQPIAGGAVTPAAGGVSKPSSFLDSIVYDKPYTAIGDAVRALLDLKRGQPVAGILLITDGNNNYGSEPADAAALAQQDKVPLYIYGVGIASPHDIIVSQLYAPDVAFVKEEVPVTVLVRSMSMSGRTAKLVLKLGGEVMDSKDVTFGADGEQTISMKFTPPRKGDYELEASIDPLPDEANKDNNKVSRRLRVIDSKIQVLYIEQKPRWEFRYLQAMLTRDPRIQAKFYLSEGDPQLGHEQGSPYLSQLPTSMDDWMKYDVIIIGNVDSKLLDNTQMQNIGDVVSNSEAGIIFIAGKKFMPNSYRGTKLENLFPVEFEGQGSQLDANRATTVNLTPAGQSSPAMRLVDDEVRNEAIWKDLPPIYWDARVIKAKPAAEVLLDDTSPEKASHNAFMPVVAIQSYGSGQALYVGTDETWRWRKNVGELYFTRFWGQMIMRLGLPRVLGASKLTQLVTDQKSYVSGARVIISGRIYRSGFQPLAEAAVTGTVTIKPDEPGTSSDLQKTVTLQAQPGKPGFYEGELTVTTPGVYSFYMASDPTAALDFRVSEPRLEFEETALNTTLLQKMADISGGAFYREEDMCQMLEPKPASATPVDTKTATTTVPKGLGASGEKIPSPEEVELAFSTYYYVLMALIATVEWILRKRWRMK
jgi:hypothetical protein